MLQLNWTYILPGHLQGKYSLLYLVGSGGKCHSFFAVHDIIRTGYLLIPPAGGAWWALISAAWCPAWPVTVTPGRSNFIVRQKLEGLSLGARLGLVCYEMYFQRLRFKVVGFCCLFFQIIFSISWHIILY